MNTYRLSEQETPTARIYEESAIRSSMRSRARQQPEAPRGEYVVTASAARRGARNNNDRVERAAIGMRALPREINRLVSEGASKDEIEALGKELDAARQTVRARSSAVPRARRRQVWREARKGRATADWRALWAEHTAKRLK